RAPLVTGVQTCALPISWPTFRGLARHLRKVFGRVPVVRPEGLEHVGIGKEGGPGLAVRAPQLRQVLKDEPEADAVPTRQSNVTRSEERRVGTGRRLGTW